MSKIYLTPEVFPLDMKMENKHQSADNLLRTTVTKKWRSPDRHFFYNRFIGKTQNTLYRALRTPAPGIRNRIESTIMWVPMMNAIDLTGPLSDMSVCLNLVSLMNAWRWNA